jgi:hypothetical protein
MMCTLSKNTQSGCGGLVSLPDGKVSAAGKLLGRWDPRREYDSYRQGDDKESYEASLFRVAMARNPAAMREPKARWRVQFGGSGQTAVSTLNNRRGIGLLYANSRTP